MTGDTVTVARLKGRLQAKGIRREDIAREAGVSQTYVSHWWNGRRQAIRIERVARRLLAQASRRGRNNGR